MNEYRDFIKAVVDICMEDLSANMDRYTHADYVIYRLNGGDKTEEDWYCDEYKSY